MANSAGPGRSGDSNPGDGLVPRLHLDVIKRMHEKGVGQLYTNVTMGEIPSELADEKKKEDKPSQAAQPAQLSPVELLYQHRYYLWQLLNGATVEQLNCASERAKQFWIEDWARIITRGYPGNTGGKSGPCSITDPNEQQLFDLVYKFYSRLPAQEANFKNWYHFEQTVAKNRFLNG